MNSNYNNSVIVIPKNKFNQIKKSSGFFNVFINTNFSNSNTLFDREGNYLLKLENLPETFYYYDKDTNTEYSFSRRAVFDALDDVLFTGRTTKPEMARFIADYFMFNRNVNFYNPTLPIPEHIASKKGHYVARPGRKSRQKTRKASSKFNNEDWNLYEPTRKEQLKTIEMAERQSKRENVEALVENILGPDRVNIVVAETEKAEAIRSKYPKSKRPSKTSKKTEEHRTNKIIRTLIRNKNRTRKAKIYRQDY